MKRIEWHRTAAAIAALFALNGCVAAALPVLAGSALATRDVVKESNERRAAKRAEGSVTVSPSESLSPPNDSASTSPSGDQTRALAISDVTSPPRGNISLMDTKSSPFFGLISYSLAQVSDETSDPPFSAVLRNPSVLDGERAQCSNGKPTILIDLDPSDATLAPDNGIQSDPVLAQGLAALRENGIEVAWISGLSADRAGDVRSALSSSGLDPANEDSLLLMRYPNDRKQTRRKELAESVCLLAIAGDDRKDFDELYDYLLKPSAAFALEPLINNGWFLTPLALTQD